MLCDKGTNEKHLQKLLDEGKIGRNVVVWICGKFGFDKEEVEDIRIDGFGERVIDAFFGSPEALKGFHEFIRSEYWRSVFGSYFEAILWYFAAPNTART